MAVRVVGAAGTELAPEELELLLEELLLEDEELEDDEELLELLLEDAPDEEPPEELEELEDAGVVTLAAADFAETFPAAS